MVQRCTEDGCREDRIVDYENREQSSRLWLEGKTWKCLKHAEPDKWLRPDRPCIETVLVATVFPDLPGHVFWALEGATRGGNGFAHGPGFRAYAADVPEGTRLRVVAALELPQSVAAVDPQVGITTG